LRIDYDPEQLREVKRELLAQNGLNEAPASYVYVQVTRGVAPRTHAFPKEPTTPTVYGFANPYSRPDEARWSQGFRAITIPDQRWTRIDIKAIALLPNVLAQQAAVDAGVDDAIYVKDGMAMEGAHNNLFAVFNGVVTTAPKTNYILHGITRDVVLELANGLDLPVEERSIPVSELYEADEVFFTGTTTEVRPTVEVDGRTVGDGTVGPVARKLFEAFIDAVNPVSRQPVT
ncbi:MAG: aminotransferase class IV, partial [Longimicrobiales bacterium]